MSVGREWVLASGLLGLLACLEPTQWVLPSPSSGARSVAIYLESEAGPNVLLAEPNDIPQAYSVVGRPTLVVFSPQTLAELGTPNLLEATSRAACDRRRPLEAIGTEAYRGGLELGWVLTTDLAEFETFSLPPIDLGECLKAGCVRRGGPGHYYCASSCAALPPPEQPMRAECPEGWIDESVRSAACRPPATRGCASSPCWIFPRELGEVCEARVQPAGSMRQEVPTLPAQVRGPLWLPRGRYTGTTEVHPGGALLGECHQDTLIVGQVVLRGDAKVSDLSLEVQPNLKGIEIHDTGSRIERVRIEGAEHGVFLNAGSQADLLSIHVTGGKFGITAEYAEIGLQHAYVTGVTNHAINLTSATGFVADLVVDSTNNYHGVAIQRLDGETSPLPFRLERAYVEGGHQAQFAFSVDVHGEHLRSDAQGTHSSGIQASMNGTSLDLERVLVSDAGADAIWARNQASVKVQDLVVLGSSGGVLCSADLELDRGHFEDLSGEAIKVTGSGDVALRDVTVLGARLGLRLLPEFDEPHNVKLSRARIEECEVGLLRGPGQVELVDVLVKEAMVGVQAEACWIDEVLSGVSMEEVATPAVIEVP